MILNFHRKKYKEKNFHNSKRSLSGLFGNIGMHMVLSIWGAISALAITWIIITSFKTNRDLFAGVWNLPKTLHWENYIRAWQTGSMSRLFPNSLLVSILGVLLLILLGSMAAYILARSEWKGKNIVLWSIIAGNAIPVQMITVPLFVMFYKLSLLNSLFGLTLIYVAISLPFTTFVMVGFFRTLPVELEEAAIIDGAGEYTVFWKIMFPIARPGIATVSIFNFIAIWNEYMLVLLLVQESANMTLPLGFYRLKAIATYNGDWVGMMAGLVILMLPTLIVFILLQELITEGLTAGAIKGG